MAESWRSENFGRLLIEVFDHFQGEFQRRFVERGGPELTFTQLAVLRNVDLDGSRMVDIARRAKLSKQHTGATVRELEELGILEVGPDEDDGRARKVRYTKAGAEGLKLGGEIVIEIMREYERSLGRSRFRELQKALDELRSTFLADD